MSIAQTSHHRSYCMLQCRLYTQQVACFSVVLLRSNCCLVFYLIDQSVNHNLRPGVHRDRPAWQHRTQQNAVKSQYLPTAKYEECIWHIRRNTISHYFKAASRNSFVRINISCISFLVYFKSLYVRELPMTHCVDFVINLDASVK